jgi:hypothetical protein
MVACWSGAPEKGERALAPIGEVAPIVAEFADTMPYVAINSPFDALVPPGLQHYWKANFLSGDDQARIRANYRGTYDRLVDVKRKYDPDNLCHLNQNIRP